MVFDVSCELRFVPVGFSTWCMGAYEGPKLLVDTIDVNLKGMFLGEGIFISARRTVRNMGARSSLW